METIAALIFTAMAALALAWVPLAWIACAAFSWILAGEKGYSKFGWFLLGVLFGPLALIATAGLPIKVMHRPSSGSHKLEPAIRA